MEPENFKHESPLVEKTNPFSLHQVTPVSKCVAMTLFILLPFVGGWIGYNYAPDKVVEVEKVVVKEVVQDNLDYVQLDNGENWVLADFSRGYELPFMLQYPDTWTLNCCGDKGTETNHFFSKHKPTGNSSDVDIVFTAHHTFDPNARIDALTTLTTPEQFELLKESYLENGEFLGTKSILGQEAYVYSLNNGTGIYTFMYKDGLYSVRFKDLDESIEDQFLERIVPME